MTPDPFVQPRRLAINLKLRMGPLPRPGLSASFQSLVSRGQVTCPARRLGDCLCQTRTVLKSFKSYTVAVLCSKGGPTIIEQTAPHNWNQKIHQHCRPLISLCHEFLPPQVVVMDVLKRALT
eukprot:4301835-Amphidinium_carterae.1